MIIYIFNTVLSVYFAFYGIKKGTRKINVFNEEYIAPQKYAFIMVCAVIIFVYAARGGTGTDTPGYISRYNHITQFDLKKIIEDNRDWLFSVVTYFDAKLFGVQGIFWHNAVIGSLMFLPLMLVYVKYSGNFPAALFLYIATSAYYFGFNGQRQGVAIGITMIGYPFLRQKKIIPWIIICLIASFFHTTAYLMIPIGLLLTQKTTSKQFIIISVASLISAFFLWSVWSRIFEFLGMLGQDKIVHDYGAMTEESSGKANSLRVLIALIPVIIGIMYYKRLKSPKFDLILNYNIWQLIFIVASTRNVFFHRCSAFFSPVQVFMFIEIGKLFDKRSKMIYWLSVCGLYLIYMWISLHNEGGMLPYQLFGTYKFY